jgi:hypothetical protein
MRWILPGGAILEEQQGNDLLLACRPQAGVLERTRSRGAEQSDPAKEQSTPSTQGSPGPAGQPGTQL